MEKMNNSRASQILDRAQQHATELGVNVCIAIVDTGAHLMAFHRMDGASLGPIDVCQRKARTAVLFGCGTGEFGDIIEQHSLLGIEQSNGGLAAFPGGLFITEENEIIGGIGVSGASAQEDHIIALYALNKES